MALRKIVSTSFRSQYGVKEATSVMCCVCRSYSCFLTFLGACKIFSEFIRSYLQCGHKGPFAVTLQHLCTVPPVFNTLFYFCLCSLKHFHLKCHKIRSWLWDTKEKIFPTVTNKTVRTQQQSSGADFMILNLQRGGKCQSKHRHRSHTVQKRESSNRCAPLQWAFVATL